MSDRSMHSLTGGEGDDPVSVTPSRPRWVSIIWLVIGVVVLAFLIVHVATGGLGQH